MTATGHFIISLDLELHWGVSDHLSVDQYRTALLGERAVIPELLRRFHQHGIHATWATVGFLFARSRNELAGFLPAVRPTYQNPALSPYALLSTVGDDERSDPFHYAYSLLQQIAATPGQEIGTHTFAHYYCLEPGQTADQFDADLAAAANIGAEFGDVCRSIVFPRNQFNPAYLSVLKRRGVRNFRGNRDAWAYHARAGRDENLARRAVRLLDAYVPVTGLGGAPRRAGTTGDLVNVPASAFLRPWSRRLAALERVRLARLKAEMTYAARTGGAFHLWWHPHNFGARPQENLAVLDEVLVHYRALNRRHGMASLSMAEAGDAARGGAHVRATAA